MTDLHAPDPMGAAAHRAAMMVSRMDLRLLGAASPTMDREERRKALELVFSQWPKVVRAMSELERAAPNAAAAGFEVDGRVLDFIEARQVSSRDLSPASGVKEGA